jgi:hypothetical protein
MWASLGVWWQRISGMVARYQKQVPNPPHDLTEYIDILGCHTSIAAAFMIVLKLSGFKMFGISLDSFEATDWNRFHPWILRKAGIATSGPAIESVQQLNESKRTAPEFNDGGQRQVYFWRFLGGNHLHSFVIRFRPAWRWAHRSQ